MLKIFICEDNNEHRKELEKVIRKIIIIENYDIEMKIVGKSPNDILNAIDSKLDTGIYFLDIDLKCNINGIELATQIRELDPRGYIVFITTHEEMSFLTFKYKVEALDYILKDNSIDLSNRIHECVKEVLKRYSISTDNNKVFSMKSKDKIINMEYSEIMFFETSQTIHKVKLHSLNREVEFYSKMKDLEKKLDENFIRCHNSYIVNKKNIKEIDITNRIVKMINGEECLVSDRGMKIFKNQKFY